MTCESLFSRMGFQCHLRSAGVYRVFTPMSFSDGEPIGLYFEEQGNSVRVSDNADTLFHLRSLGLDVGDRKRWGGVRNIVSRFGISLEQNGEVTGLARSGAAAGLVSRYIGAMLAIADLERELTGITPELSEYIDEVEGYLRLLKPMEKLVRSPQVTGHSGRAHVFHFRLGKEFVDAARPHSGRTGSILRKSADIQNTDAPSSVLVVMDDREDPERARTESDILSTLVKVIPFSTLAANFSAATRQ